MAGSLLMKRVIATVGLLVLLAVATTACGYTPQTNNRPHQSCGGRYGYCFPGA